MSSQTIARTNRNSSNTESASKSATTVVPLSSKAVLGQRNSSIDISNTGDKPPLQPRYRRRTSDNFSILQAGRHSSKDGVHTLANNSILDGENQRPESSIQQTRPNTTKEPQHAVPPKITLVRRSASFDRHKARETKSQNNETAPSHEESTSKVIGRGIRRRSQIFSLEALASTIPSRPPIVPPTLPPETKTGPVLNSVPNKLNVTTHSTKDVLSNCEPKAVALAGHDTSKISAPSKVSPQAPKSTTAPSTSDSLLRETPFQLAINTVEQLKNFDFGRKDHTLADFDIGKCLGKGRFGQLYLVREKKSRFICALKVMFMNNLAKNRVLHQVQREIEIHYRIRHPNIIRMYGFFSDTERIYLIVDFAQGGDLYTKFKSCGKRFTNEMAAVYTYQIANGLAYLHANKIIHRDLKPENVLLDTKGTCMICDFGWAVASKSTNDGVRTTYCGTPDYLAPETLAGRYEDGVDVWALGCMLYEFHVGGPPFEDRPENTQNRIRNCLFRIPPTLPEPVAKLIRQMLRKEPILRITAADLLKDLYLLRQWQGYQKSLTDHSGSNAINTTSKAS